MTFGRMTLGMTPLTIIMPRKMTFNKMSLSMIITQKNNIIPIDPHHNAQ